MPVLKKYAGAAALFEAFAEDPEYYWEQQGGAERQSQKLRAFLRGKAKALGMDTRIVLSQVESVASARAVERPPPIYVMGIGGSGSHWLASMLSELVASLNVGEVHIPAGLVRAMTSLSADEQGFLVDCVHLLHARGDLSEPTDAVLKARVVNAADGVIHPGFRAWDPQCCVIHLLRDPRDRTMSVTFRKPGFRKAQYPDLSDEEYLVRQARSAAQNFAAWQSAPLAPDLLCRYEELRASTVDVLKRIVAIVDEPADPDRLAQVSREHDASLIRSGATPSKANLFPRASSGWREETDQRQRALLHSLLTEVVTRAEYPADDCLGLPLELEMPAPPKGKRLHLPEGGKLGAMFAREPGPGGTAWAFHSEARGPVVIPEGSHVKLRVHETAGAAAIASLGRLALDELDSLCLSGNRDVNDELLGAVLPSLGGLQELDLSHTSATDAALPALARLPRLRGVNLLGIGSPQGAESLRQALPELKVVSDEEGPL